MPDSTGSDTRHPDDHEHDHSDITDVPAFREWRSRLPSFELDGERLYLPTGDIPMDENQIEELWARQHSKGSPGGSSTK